MAGVPPQPNSPSNQLIKKIMAYKMERGIFVKKSQIPKAEKVRSRRNEFFKKLKIISTKTFYLIKINENVK